MLERVNDILKGHENLDTSRILRNVHIFSVFFICIIYSGIYLFFGAKLMALVLVLGASFFTPIVYYFNKNRYYTGAKMLMILFAMFSIAVTRLGIKEDIETEMFLIPSILAILLFFDLRQKIELTLSIIMIFCALLYLKWGPQLNLSSEWYAQNLPVEFFKTFSFISSFALTCLYSVKFSTNVLALKASLQEELERSKEIEKVLDQAQTMAKVGNWELDLRTRAIYCSKEQLRLYEMDPNSPIPIHEQYQQRLHPDNKDSEQKMLKQVMETKKGYTQETRIVLKSGENKTFLSYAEPVFDSDGNIIKLIGMAQDITDRKTKEIELIQKQIQLERQSRLAALGEMAAGVAHEINNPLAIIIGKAAIISKKVELGPIDSEKIILDLNKVVTTAKRIEKIVRGLRTMGRQTQFDPMEKTNLCQILTEVLDICHVRLKSAQIEVRSHLIQDLEIECRGAEIGQVLLNILNNAIDAVSILDSRWIEIHVVDQEKTVEITVVDSGHGIPPDVVEKIMNPFFTTKPVGKGTGIGLSISFGIIKNHNGDLCYKTINNHTGFVITLPKFQPREKVSTAA